MQLFSVLIQLTSYVPSFHPFFSKPNHPKFNSKTLIHALVSYIITYSKVSPNSFLCSILDYNRTQLLNNTSQPRSSTFTMLVPGGRPYADRRCIPSWKNSIVSQHLRSPKIPNFLPLSISTVQYTITITITKFITLNHIHTFSIQFNDQFNSKTQYPQIFKP